MPNLNATTTTPGYSVSVSSASDGSWTYRVRVGNETHHGHKDTLDEANDFAYALLERLQRYEGTTAD